MKDQIFKEFCSQLEQDKSRNESNPLKQISEKYKQGKLKTYDYIDSMHKYNQALYFFADYIKNTDISEIEIRDNSLIFTTRKDGIRLLFDGKYRRGVPFEILNWGSYEMEESSIISALIEKNMTILDVGTNIGWFSLLWAKRHPSIKIHAFEPIKHTYKYCVSNCIINNLKNIEVHNIGLSNKDSSQEFFYSDESSSLASAKNIIGYKKAQKIESRLRTLDSIYKELSINKIDFIKCDLEGAELDFLTGGLETIKKQQPIILMEVFHKWTDSFNYHPNELFELMYSLGYKSFLPNQGKLKECLGYSGENFKNQNVIFLHEINHQEKLCKLWALDFK